MCVQKKKKLNIKIFLNYFIRKAFIRVKKKEKKFI